MKVRKHFRNSISTIDYIISDLNKNPISNKKEYLKKSVDNRLDILNKNYDEKLDKIITSIISNCNYELFPIQGIIRIMSSLTKITKAFSKGLLNLIEREE